MPNRARAHGIPAALPLWVLWHFDGAGIWTRHEGPGLMRKGLGSGDVLGTSVWERHRGEPSVLHFCRAALRAPTVRLVYFGGEPYYVYGCPAPDGGAQGVSVAADDLHREASDPHGLRGILAEGCSGLSAVHTPPPVPRSEVYEYAVNRPIPEIGARVWDVLAWDYPQVILSRKRNGEWSHWTYPLHYVFLFLKYEDHLQPLFEECPRMIQLARLAVGDPRSPRPEAEAPPLRLLR
jgi:hypothetical protein